MTMNTVYTTTFDEGFYDYRDIGELTCPNGWFPKWVQGPGGGVLHRPEFDAKDRNLGHPEVYEDNRFAAAVMQTSATHKCCLWRQFQVEPGKVVASGVAMIRSHRGAGHGLRMGIDPSGGTNFLGDRVVWGPWWSTYMDEWRDGDEGQWHPLEIEARASGTIVTVFLNSRIDFAENAAGIWGEVILRDSREDGPPGGNEQVVADLVRLQIDINMQIDGLIAKYI